MSLPVLNLDIELLQTISTLGKNVTFTERPLLKDCLKNLESQGIKFVNHKGEAVTTKQIMDFCKDHTTTFSAQLAACASSTCHTMRDTENKLGDRHLVLAVAGYMDYVSLPSLLEFQKHTMFAKNSGNTMLLFPVKSYPSQDPSDIQTKLNAGSKLAPEIQKVMLHLSSPPGMLNQHSTQIAIIGKDGKFSEKNTYVMPPLPKTSKGRE